MITGRNAAARALGISPQALGKAEKVGRVTKTPEGLYDVEQCREQLKRNSNPIKQASARAQQQQQQKIPKHTRRTEPFRAMAAPPVSEDDSQQEQQQLPPQFDEEPNDGLRAITIQREMLKLKKERREFLREGKRLVDGRKVRAEMIERAANERQALLNIPKRWSPLVATELGAEERKVYTALTRLVRDFLTERSSIPVDRPSTKPVPPSPVPPSPEMPPPPPLPHMTTAEGLQSAGC